MAYGIRLHVWGQNACFTRPEMKVERVSYDVITPSAARGILEALLRRGLIRVEGEPPRYTFNPSGPASPELMSDVAREYQRHLVPIATFIHSKASASVREFARAFDLKKDR